MITPSGSVRIGRFATAAVLTALLVVLRPQPSTATAPAALPVPQRALPGSASARPAGQSVVRPITSTASRTRPLSATVGQAVRPADTRGLPPAPTIPAPSHAAPVRQMVSPGARPTPAEHTGWVPEIDDTLQTAPGAVAMPTPVVSFEGIASRDWVLPPDTDGQVGPNHYVQMVNLSTSIHDKAGNRLYGPFHPSDLWPSGDPCRDTNDGDPVVLYDQLADRWLLSQFGLPNYPNGPFYECIAVSKDPTPTNNPNDWYPYTFLVHETKMNDYPKLGIWPDGYYMTANQFNEGSPTWAGAGAWVFDRQAMLAGQSASFQYVDLYPLDPYYGGLLPANLMGSTPPPTGAASYIGGVDRNWSGPRDMFHIFEFHVDWDTPANTTFDLVADLQVDDFDWGFSGMGIPQPATSVELDALADRLMMHLWYRNFGDHEALVTNHTVNIGSVNDQAAVRWYEIRGGALDTTFADATVHQQGTYAPDGNHRWMGSVAMDHVGNIALGYSISSASLYPSIRVAGRLSTDPLGQLPQAEETLMAGGGSQLFWRGRWGDYSAMSVDPVDDCTFWYTQEYLQSTSNANWRTRVAAFRFPNCSTSPQGALAGIVYDSAGTPSSDGVGGAIVRARDGMTYALETATLADGSYTLALPTGIYTVTADAYGYVPTATLDVEIVHATTTSLDLPLTAAQPHSVTGQISDAAAGWPLHARILVDGEPFSPPLADREAWSDPFTGRYSLTLPAGITYTFHVEAWSPGYNTLSRAVGPLTGPTTEDFALSVNLATCQAPGYVTVAATCTLQSGGLVAGHVFDDNTSSPLDDALIASDSGSSATSGSTEDPTLHDGFYVLFVPNGPHTLTATQTAYGPGVASVTTVQSATVGQDFWLPAAMPVYTPTGLAMTLTQGQSATLPLTLANTGGWPLAFEWLERLAGYTPPAGPSQVRVTVDLPDELAWDRDSQRSAKRARRVAADVAFTITQVVRPNGPIEVLLLTPDGDTSLIEQTLNAFGDLSITKWTDGHSGDPLATDLGSYDVVIVGNDLLWSDAGMTAQGVGDALADYIDEGGHVIDTLFVHDWYGWQLAGRYIDEGYGPFAQATRDLAAPPYHLGAIHQPHHALLQGVSVITDSPSTGLGHQNVGLRAGASRIADWSSGEVYLAERGSVVGVNQLWFEAANWSGDVPMLMHNAITYLAQDGVDWLAEAPISDTLQPAAVQPISVTFDASAPSITTPGIYRAILILDNDSPYGKPMLPITLTVLSAPEPTWQKRLMRSGSDITTTGGLYALGLNDTFTIVDRVWISSTRPTSFTLEERWTPSVTLQSWAPSAGIVTETALSLAWRIEGLPSAQWYALTKTFQAQPVSSGWDRITITETLSVDDLIPQPLPRTIHLLPTRWIFPLMLRQ